MKIRVLYRPDSEHARSIEEFFREFQQRSPHDVEMMSIDTREGAAQADLYGIMAYPAILVVNNSGEVMKSWEGEDLPLMDEIMSYANA